ncbi:hypothetical protein ACLOJK_014535 [Asimina triloba]
MDVRMCCSLRCTNGEVVRVAAFWNLRLLQFDMVHHFADEGRSIGRFAIWPRCWTGGKNRMMGLDSGSCSCLPSPFDLGLPVGHRDGSSCYCSDRLRDGFHAAWNGFCLDSALKPAGLFGCGWPRRTRKLLAVDLGMRRWINEMGARMVLAMVGNCNAARLLVDVFVIWGRSVAAVFADGGLLPGRARLICWPWAIVTGRETIWVVVVRCLDEEMPEGCCRCAGQPAKKMPCSALQISGLDLGLTRCRRSFGWVRSADLTLAGVGSNGSSLEKMEHRISVLRWCIYNCTHAVY